MGPLYPLETMLFVRTHPTFPGVLEAPMIATDFGLKNASSFKQFTPSRPDYEGGITIKTFTKYNYIIYILKVKS